MQVVIYFAHLDAPKIYETHGPKAQFQSVSVSFEGGFVVVRYRKPDDSESFCAYPAWRVNEVVQDYSDGGKPVAPKLRK